jgi:hypothetical protein
LNLTSDWGHLIQWHCINKNRNTVKFSHSIMSSVTLQMSKMVYLKHTLNTIYIKYSHNTAKLQNDTCVLEVQRIKIYKDTKSTA